MRTKHTPGFLLQSALLLLMCLTAGAQEYIEKRDFQEDAGSLSLLYKGMITPSLKVAANGNQYWQSPEFRRGSITLDGRTYDNVLVNFDASRQLVLTTAYIGAPAVALPSEKVAGFSMEEKRFVKIEGSPGIPDGFYHEVYAGQSAFYMHVQKPLETSFTNVNGTFIGYEDPDYDSRKVDFYYYKTSYYLRDALGHFRQIRTRNALLRQFPKQKRALRRHMSDVGMTSRKVALELYAAELLRFAEQ